MARTRGVNTSEVKRGLWRGGVMGENEVSKSMEEDGSRVSHSPRREKTHRIL